MSDAVAILVFARPVSDDAARKRLTNQAGLNRRVLSCLTEHTTQRATATGLPVLRSTDLIMHRGSFGSQLVAALQAAFNRGFTRVVVVGNDCPGLTPTILLDAANALSSTPVVLGPDRRGGLYLLGLTRAAFDQNRLAQLPWQTPRLGRATCQAFCGCSLTVLTQLGDVNQLTDLQTYQLVGTAVKAFVAALLALMAAQSGLGISLVSQRLKSIHQPDNGTLRGPPTAHLHNSFAVV